MKQTVDGKNRIPLLIRSDGVVIAFDKTLGGVVVGEEVVNEMKREKGKLLIHLAEHPGQVQTWRQIDKALHPKDVLPDENGEFFARNLRPMVFHLRRDLEEIQPELKDTIRSVRGTGLFYNPHESTGVKPKRVIINLG